MMDMAASETSDFFDYEAEPVDYRRPRKRYWLDVPRIVGLVLLILLLLIIVVLLVYFLHPGNSCGVPKEESNDVAPKPVIDYRLPGALFPTLYKLRLRPDIYTGNPSTFTFSGSVTIHLTCVENTKEIVLHASELLINEQSVLVSDLAGDKYIDVTHTRNDSLSEKYIIAVKGKLKKNKRYTVSLAFSGIIQSNLRGIYYTSYDIDEQRRYALASQLQPTDARRIFPCMDEPQLKAAFDVSIERKSDFTSMSNGVIEETETLDGGWVRDHYSRTPVMSIYLLAFVVSDFPCVDSSSRYGTQIKICCRSNAIEQTALANSVAGPIQDFFEDYYNVSYPMPIMRHVSVPDFGSGGMENWGLVLYGDYYLLYNNETSTSVHEQSIITIIAHELAHQWFGNLVSMEWWDDIWLNEGFASYMEVVGTQQVRPEWEMEDSFILSKVQRVFIMDSLSSSHPIYQPVESPSQISALFDAITYGKGASIIRMMNYFLGEHTFRSALSKYLTRLQYKSATYKDLFNFFTEEARLNGQDIDVNEIMNTWILQLGYPVVTFSYDRSTNKVTVSQKHFLLDPNTRGALPESPYGYQWKVPISYITDRDTNLDDYLHYNNWLYDQTMQMDDVIDSQTKWILGNVKQRFYYRVNYDEDNWHALLQELMESHKNINIKNRAQLIDDSFNLGRAGEVSQLLFLNISRYLDYEKDYVPWASALRRFEFLDRILASTGDFGLLQSYLQKIIQGSYIRLGWVSNATISHTEKKMQSMIVSSACYYELPDCVSQARRKFVEWSEDTSNYQMSPNYRYVVFCEGVAAGLQQEWDFVFDYYKQVTASDEKRTILKALGCSRQDWILRRYLEIAMEENDIRRQDFSWVFTSVAANPIGSSMAWELLANNWETIEERFTGRFAFEYIITASTKWMSTEFHYGMVKSFVESRRSLGSGVMAFNQALEKIRSNIDWRSTNQEAVSKWLTNELTHKS